MKKNLAKKYLQKPICCLVILSLFLQFIPSPKPAQATWLDSAGKWLNKITQSLTIPSVLLDEQGYIKVGSYPLPINCLGTYTDKKGKEECINPFTRTTLSIFGKTAKSQKSLVVPVIKPGCGEMTEEIWDRCNEEITPIVIIPNDTEKVDPVYITKQITGCEAIPCLEPIATCNTPVYAEYAKKESAGCYDWYMGSTEYPNEKESDISKDNDSWRLYWEQGLGKTLGTFENVKKAYIYYSGLGENVSVLARALKNLSGHPLLSEALDETSPKYPNLYAYVMSDNNVEADPTWVWGQGGEDSLLSINLTAEDRMQKRHDYFLEKMTAMMPSLKGLADLDGTSLNWWGPDGSNSTGRSSTRRAIKTALDTLQAGITQDVAIFGLTIEQIKEKKKCEDKLLEEAKASPECINPNAGELLIPKPFIPEQCEVKISLPSDPGADNELQKLAQKKACIYLIRLQDAAAQEVFAANKIFNATDPFTDCLFIRNCRSNCTLRLGELTFTVTLLDVAALFVPGGFLTVIQKILNIYKIINEAWKILNAVKGLFDSGVSFINQIFNVMGQVSALFESFANSGLKMGDVLIYGGGAVASYFGGKEIQKIGVDKGGNIGWLIEKGGDTLTMGDGLMGGAAATMVFNTERAKQASEGMQGMLASFAQNNLKFAIAKKEAIQFNLALKNDIENVRGVFKQEQPIAFLFNPEDPKKAIMQETLNNFSLFIRSVDEFLNEVKDASSLKDGRPITELMPGGGLSEWQGRFSESSVGTKFVCSRGALQLPLGGGLPPNSNNFNCFIPNMAKPVSPGWLKAFQDYVGITFYLKEYFALTDSDVIKKALIGCDDLSCFKSGGCPNGPTATNCIKCYGKSDEKSDDCVIDYSNKSWREYWEKFGKTAGTFSNVKAIYNTCKLFRQGCESTLRDAVTNLAGLGLQDIDKALKISEKDVKYKNLFEFSQSIEGYNMQEKHEYLQAVLSKMYPLLWKYQNTDSTVGEVRVYEGIAQLDDKVNGSKWKFTRGGINGALFALQEGIKKEIGPQAGFGLDFVSQYTDDLWTRTQQLSASTDLADKYWGDIYWFPKFLPSDDEIGGYKDYYGVWHKGIIEEQQTYEGEAAFEYWDGKIDVVKSNQENFEEVRQALELGVSPEKPIVVYKIAQANKAINDIKAKAGELKSDSSWTDIINKIMDSIVYGTPTANSPNAICSALACPKAPLADIATCLKDSNGVCRDCHTKSINDGLKNNCTGGIFQTKIYPNEIDYRNYANCCTDKGGSENGENRCCNLGKNCLEGYTENFNLYTSENYFTKCANCEENCAKAQCATCQKDDGVVAPVCGNGGVEDDEACDDGNTRDHDGCSHDCKDENFVCSGAQCIWAGFGAGIYVNSNCDGKCSIAAECGNGIIEGTEQCDDGNAVNTDACVKCKIARCGDNYRWTGHEECDDGNTQNGDGCSSTCKNEVDPTVYVCFNSRCETRPSSANLMNTFPNLQACIDSRCEGAPPPVGKKYSCSGWPSYRCESYYYSNDTREACEASCKDPNRIIRICRNLSYINPSYKWPWCACEESPHYQTDQQCFDSAACRMTEPECRPLETSSNIDPKTAPVAVNIIDNLKQRLGNFAKNLFGIPNVFAAVVQSFCYPNVADICNKSYRICNSNEAVCTANYRDNCSCNIANNVNGHDNSCYLEEKYRESYQCFETHEPIYRDGFTEYDIGLKQISYFNDPDFRKDLGLAITIIADDLQSASSDLSRAFEKLQTDWMGVLLGSLPSQNQESATARAQIEQIIKLKKNSEKIINEKIPDVEIKIANVKDICNQLREAINNASKGVDVAPLQNIVDSFDVAINLLQTDVINFVYEKIGPKGIGYDAWNGYSCNDNKCGSPSGKKTFLCRLKCFEETNGKKFSQLLSYMDVLERFENASYALSQAQETLPIIEPSLDMEPLEIKPSLSDEISEKAQCCKGDCPKETTNTCEYKKTYINAKREGAAETLRCSSWTKEKCSEKTTLFVGQRSDESSFEKFKTDLLANPFNTLRKNFEILRNYLDSNSSVSISTLLADAQEIMKSGDVFGKDIFGNVKKGEKGDYGEQFKSLTEKARELWEDLIWGNEASEKTLLACDAVSQVLNGDPEYIAKQCEARVDKVSESGEKINVSLLPPLAGGSNSLEGYNELKNSCSLLSKIDLDVLDNITNDPFYIDKRVASLTAQRSCITQENCSVGEDKCIVCPKWFCVNQETFTWGAGMMEVDPYCVEKCVCIPPSKFPNCVKWETGQSTGYVCDSGENIIWNTSVHVALPSSNPTQKICDNLGLNFANCKSKINGRCQLINTFLGVASCNLFNECSQEELEKQISIKEWRDQSIANKCPKWFCLNNNGNWQGSAGMASDAYCIAHCGANDKQDDGMVCADNGIIWSTNTHPTIGDQVWPPVKTPAYTGPQQNTMVANCIKAQQGLQSLGALELPLSDSTQKDCSPVNPIISFCKHKMACETMGKACDDWDDQQAEFNRQQQSNKPLMQWPPTTRCGGTGYADKYIGAQAMCIGTQQEIIYLKEMQVMVNDIKESAKIRDTGEAIDFLINRCNKLDYQKSFAKDCYDFSVLQKAFGNNTAINENWKKWNPNEYTTKPPKWNPEINITESGVVTTEKDDIKNIKNDINGFCDIKTEGKILGEKTTAGLKDYKAFQCGLLGNTVGIDMTLGVKAGGDASVQEKVKQAQDARDLAGKICSQSSSDMRTPLNEVMKVFSVLLGVKSYTSAKNGLSTLYFDAQKMRQRVADTVALIKGFPDKFMELWGQEDTVSKITGDSVDVKPLMCIEGPMTSYAGGSGKALTGPKGGQVCPDVAEQFSQLDTMFAQVRQNFKMVDSARRDPSKTVGLFNDNLKIEISSDDINDELNEVVEPLYRRAEAIKEKSQLLWALATAINFANENCTCGQSYCPMIGKVPFCVSGLPITLNPLKEPFCHLVWTLRYPLGSLAERIKQDIESPLE